jgi:hypothetical protein
VRLYDAGGDYLAGDIRGGPGVDAFLSGYRIASSGTYYVQVESYREETAGSYEVRVDLARGIDMESDADYANDSIGGWDSSWLGVIRPVTKLSMSMIRWVIAWRLLRMA